MHALHKDVLAVTHVLMVSEEIDFWLSDHFAIAAAFKALSSTG